MSVLPSDQIITFQISPTGILAFLATWPSTRLRSKKVIAKKFYFAIRGTYLKGTRVIRRESCDPYS